MKIAYISHLSTNIAAGPNWSVPAGIRAQEQIDEVLWINTTDVVMPHWKDVKAYNNLKDLGGKLCLDILPMSFRRPDVVVFEGIYFTEYVKFAKELRRENIPYIIVPRGSMTHQAMHNHAWLKKWVAHKLFFNRFIRHAWKIQYLTQQEAFDSCKQFKTPFFIVPNGVTLPSITKDNFSTKGIKALFIGRIDLYHKGLDLLLDAVTQAKEYLRKDNFHLDMYGPRRYDFYKIREEISKRDINDIVELHDEVGGQAKQEVLLNTNLFVMTSRFEGHPMGLIEALAYGIPCLVTPGTNMAEEVESANAGWVCQGNVESIAATIISIIEQKKSLSKKGENARALSLQYDWTCLANRFHNEIHEFE